MSTDTRNEEEKSLETIPTPSPEEEKIEITEEEQEEKKPLTEGLPMTVQLRGYEDYFEEFSWDAKKVMEVLGIKRSRLNQISGEELRVGRARIDRYLRPIYRPEDVKDYLAWTKPTASHKRSTSIIDEARQKLDETSGELKEKLIGSQEALKEELSSLLEQNLGRLTRNYEHLGDSLSQKLSASFEKKTEENNFLTQKLLQQNEKLSKTLESLLEAEKSHRSSLAILKEENRKQRQAEADINSSLEKLERHLSCLEKEQKSFASSLTQKTEKLTKLFGDKGHQKLSLSERKQIHRLKPFTASRPSPKKSKTLSIHERKKIKPLL